MFLENRYTRTYYAIIEKARYRTLSGYSEKHHIEPKSLGGSDDPSNLVSLTAKEHFVCHMLLVRMTTGEAKRKMSYGLWAMTKQTRRHERIISSGQYEFARIQFAKATSQTPRTAEWNNKISAAQKGKPKPHKKGNPFRNRLLTTKRWRVTHPDGTVEVIVNMARFCKKHGLSAGNMSGGRTKGYKAECLGDVREERAS